MITLDTLQKRREDLSIVLTKSKVDLDLLKGQMKAIKEEIANVNGAIIEIDYMIQAI